MSALPWLGLGVSSNLNAQDTPHPYRLLRSRPGLFDYVEYSAPLSLAVARQEASLFEEMWRHREAVPVLFHPVHLNLYGPALEDEATLSQLNEHVRAVGSAWVGNDVGWWHAGGQPFPGYLYLPPPLNAFGLADAAAHAAHVQAHLEVPLALENPAVIALRGEWHVLDFMAKLHERTGAPLILDVGHLWSYQLARGLPIDAGLDGFPLDQVIELHVAGGIVCARDGRRFYLDDHPQPIREELFELLGRIVPRCARLRAVTYEADGHSMDAAALNLERLRALVPPKRPRLNVAAAARREAPTTLSADAWGIYERAYAGIADEDGVGSTVERSWRLTLLAQQLDRSWPVTRLLVCPDVEALRRFAASDELRGRFERGTELDSAFFAYVRRRLRERPDDGIATAVAFESWLLAAMAREARSTFIGQFTADLGELLSAAKAVRRQLGAAHGAFVTLEAHEALRQVAARVKPKRWHIAVRGRGGAREIAGISSEVPSVLAALPFEGRWDAFVAGRSDAFARAAQEALGVGLICEDTALARVSLAR